jgi:hypothetical protein
MANEIGFSTIYPSSGLGLAGPVGATGATGADQTVRGSTGATGLDSNYITSVIVTEAGAVEFRLSDGVIVSPGTLRGATGVYAGVTAFSLGSGTSILKGVCGGITLDFYNFRTDGLLGITYSTDGALVFTISANSGAGGISPSIENDRIVYAESKTTIMSTDLIPEASNSANRIQADDINYGYVNFGGETAGRNIVADITDSSLSVGPIERGEFTVNLSDFYSTGVEGITLDLSRATVYNLVTPLGIKAFTTSNIGLIPLGQIMSVTLIVHGEDIWNFPEDVVFDAESKPIFYPGVNILHMWKTNTDENWRASFTARGIGAFDIENPGVRGSCCYFDVDETKHCDDYVTQTYCKERSGNFEALVPCDKNSCIVGTKEFDGICCTEGRCVSDLDPSLCQTIGGYFISGITCGQYGEFPDNDVDNIGSDSGLCYNTCKTPTICCKNGTCLGQLTEAHCDYLEGITVPANNCNSAKCCDHILAPGACCTQTNTGAFECTVVDTPYDCNSNSGIYMGKNTKCNPDENICCTVANQLTCYECTGLSTGICSCAPRLVNALSCEDEQLYTNSNCNNNCQTKTCHQCSGTQCDEQTTACGEACPSGFTEGPCVENVTCQTRKCYAPCVNNTCQSSDITLGLGNNTNTPCEQLSTDFPNDICDCVTVPPGNEPHAACFWCFPILLDSNILMYRDSAGNRLAAPPNIGDTNPGLGTEDAHVRQVSAASQAPFRSVFSVSADKAAALNDAAGYVEGRDTLLPRSNANANTIGITLPAGLNPNGYSLSRTSNILYYDETDTAAFISRNIGRETGLNGIIGEVLRADVYRNLDNRDVNFRCYYVGSYQHTTDKPKAKENCLKRYGYTGAAELSSCVLCDPVDYSILPEQPFVDNVIEPYQDKIKGGFYAPFPPLWGRITYKWKTGTCNPAREEFRCNTYNLNLFTDSNIKSIVTAFLLKKGKGWLNDFLTEYDSYDQFGPDSNLKNQELHDGLLTTMKEELVGSIVPAPDPSDDSCVSNDPYGYNTQRFEFDPYGFGCSQKYCTAYNVNARDCPLNELHQTACCFNQYKGYALPYPGWDKLPSGSIDADYYPLDSNPDPTQNNPINPSSIQSVGERYLRKLPSDTNPVSNYVRGIFGRNLRYNLDSFRTSTVFYHEQLDIEDNLVFATTMKETDKVVIPIVHYASWEANVVNCGPCSANPCGCSEGCQANPADPTDCCFNVPGSCLCVYREPPELQLANFNPDLGLVSPSTVINKTPFKVQIKKSQISTKSVYITPGICVDMLCPDCNSYESC